MTDPRIELSRLRLPELVALAAERGIVGAAKLRKGELVDTLAENEDGATIAPETSAPVVERYRRPRRWKTASWCPNPSTKATGSL